MNKVLCLMLSMCFLFTLGCKEVEIENGQIPDEYLEQAKFFAGDYFGSFNGFKGTLTLSLDGNKMVASYKNKFGTDLVDPKCNSEIGDLLTINVKKSGDKYTLKRATFSFYPNLCHAEIEGEKLRLNIVEKSGGIHLKVSILEWGYWDQECEYIYTGNGGFTKQCHYHYVENYIRGRFKKIN